MTDNNQGKSSFWNRLRKAVPKDGAEMSFVDHLESLRWHIMRSAIVWLAASIVIFIKIDWVFDNIIYAPAESSFISYRALCSLSHYLKLGDALCMPPLHIELLGTTVSGPFSAAISIGLIGGLIAAFPYLFWELWRFIKPALSSRELKYSRGAIAAVSFCFFTGAAFGYFILAPFTFNFLANFTLGTMGAYKYLPSLDDYVSTLTDIILYCGLAFELPVLAYVLARIGLITSSFLRTYRKYALVLILVAAAIITPSPDWTSQMIVALPLMMLYEISIFICRRVDKKQEKEDRQWS